MIYDDDNDNEDGDYVDEDHLFLVMLMMFKIK